jgi:hypothetical protein
MLEASATSAADAGRKDDSEHTEQDAERGQDRDCRVRAELADHHERDGNHGRHHRNPPNCAHVPAGA